MSKETFYFSHDYSSRSDSKIKKLISKHGLLGYGVFWAIVEDLYMNANALPMDCESIAYDLRADVKVVESILKDFDLFVFEGDTFGSMSVQKRMDARAEKSTKARASADKRWNKNANALPPQTERIDISCEGNAIKESIVKENKGKEKKPKVKLPDKNPAYAPCMDIYNEFIKKQTGVPAKINSLTGQSLNKILDYLGQIEKIQSDPVAVTVAFQFISPIMNVGTNSIKAS